MRHAGIVVWEDRAIGRRCLIAFLAAALLAGCGTATEPDNGVADKTADAAVADAVAAAAAAGSVRLEVTGASSDDGTPTEYDLRMSDEGTTGWMSFDGRPIDVLRIGETAYFRAPPEFFRTGDAQGDLAADLLGDRWIVASGDMFGSGAVPTMDDLFEGLLSQRREFEHAGEETIDGPPAVALRDADSGAMLYVASTGEPLPLAYRDARNELVFDEWGEPVELEPPDDPLEPTGAQNDAIDAAFAQWYPAGWID